MPALDDVYADLRQIMAPYAAQLDVKRDDAQELYLDTRHLQTNKKPLFFGAVQLKKASVSFHLMPVYLAPALLDAASAELKGRMQGKSCFNFKAGEPALFQELSALTEQAFADYRRQGFV